MQVRIEKKKTTQSFLLNNPINTTLQSGVGIGAREQEKTFK